MTRMIEKEVAGRIAILAGRLREEGIDFALLSQNADRYYYTGTMQDGVLLVPTENPPVLFIKRTLSRACEESPLDRIIGYRRLQEIHSYTADNSIKSRIIGLDMDVITAKFYLTFTNLYPDSRFVDISSVIRKQRAIKSTYEVSLLQEGGRRVDRVFEKIKREIKTGVCEYELDMKFTQMLQQEGSSLFIRTRMFNMESEPKYILSGESASKFSSADSPSGGGEGISRAFPRGAGFKSVGKNEPILIDSVFVYKGYMVDCTRIFAIGKLESDFTQAHGISRACHEIFCENAARGVYIPELYGNILDFVHKHGFADVFMGGVKFIGHGVGLELDEFPVITSRYADSIEDGMVIAFEPKFVFKNGTVGYENTYLIEKGMVRALTCTEESIQYL